MNIEIDIEQFKKELFKELDVPLQLAFMDTCDTAINTQGGITTPMAPLKYKPGFPPQVGFINHWITGSSIGSNDLTVTLTNNKSYWAFNQLGTKRIPSRESVNFRNPDFVNTLISKLQNRISQT